MLAFEVQAAKQSFTAGKALDNYLELGVLALLWDKGILAIAGQSCHKDRVLYQLILPSIAIAFPQLPGFICSIFRERLYCHTRQMLYLL